MKGHELYAAIDRQLQRQADSGPAALEPPVDLAVAMGAVDDDKELLIELVSALLDDYPRQLAELREAISNGNAYQTQQAAHSLKGAVANFGAKAAYTLAYTLETMGREARLDHASTVLQQLEREMARVSTFFAEPGWEERV